MNDLLFELPLPEDFDLGACLEYMNRSPLECLFRTDKAGVSRMFRIEGGPLLVRLSVSENHKLSVTRLHGAIPGALEQEWLARYIVEWFDLDRDLAPFYRLAAMDPLLGPLASEHRGCGSSASRICSRRYAGRFWASR